MASIFDRIFRYRQTDGRTPHEDYFTELFASILEKCGPLGIKIVGKLIGPDGPDDLIDITRVAIRTQKSFHVDGQNLRVDMYGTAWVETKRHVLVIESKIDSVQGDGQLEAYIDLLAAAEKNAASRTLAYITKNSEDLGGQALGARNPNVGFMHLKWSQVYGWIKEFVDGEDGDNLPCKELLNDFLALMEDWSMGGSISARAMRAAIIYHNSLNSGARIYEPIDTAWKDSGIENGVDWGVDDIIWTITNVGKVRVL